MSFLRMLWRLLISHIQYIFFFLLLTVLEEMILNAEDDTSSTSSTTPSLSDNVPRDQQVKKYIGLLLNVEKKFNLAVKIFKKNINHLLKLVFGF